jgi:hypothetical protein
MSGQQYMQALQQSPYYQAVKNSPYVTPQQLPLQQSPWAQVKQGFNAPLQSDIMAAQQFEMAKMQKQLLNSGASAKPAYTQQRN